MDSNKTIKVLNRNNGPVGYYLPELRVRRQFQPREEKQITLEELRQLSYARGGRALLDKYLVVKDEEAIKELYPKVEPEYFYTPKDVKRILTTASYAEFLDCLDFAPGGVLEMLQDMAVELEINDIKKRKAILDKLGLDIDSAIKIKNTKYDGETEATAETQTVVKRRVAAPTVSAEPAQPTRRYAVKETSAE